MALSTRTRGHADSRTLPICRHDNVVVAAQMRIYYNAVPSQVGVYSSPMLLTVSKRTRMLRKTSRLLCDLRSYVESSTKGEDCRHLWQQKKQTYLSLKNLAETIIRNIERHFHPGLFIPTGPKIHAVANDPLISIDRPRSGQTLLNPSKDKVEKVLVSSGNPTGLRWRHSSKVKSWCDNRRPS